jgi:hypothetical protein
MTALGILWVVLTPYCTGLAVAWAPPANRFVGNHLVASASTGWLALATVLAGVFAVGEDLGMAMAIVSAPFVGLAFWTTRSGPDDDDGTPPPPPDGDPPAPDTVDTKRVRLQGPRRTRPTGHRPAPRTRIPTRAR